MEHNMARNPNWWEANKLAMLQAWLLEDLNSGPSGYTSSVLFTRDDVVSQRLKFGSAFLSSSWESKIALFF